MVALGLVLWFVIIFFAMPICHWCITWWKLWLNPKRVADPPTSAREDK
jgi:hypothetical protein